MLSIQDEVDELRQILDTLESERIKANGRATVGFLLERSPNHQRLLKWLEDVDVGPRIKRYAIRFVGKGENYG